MIESFQRQRGVALITVLLVMVIAIAAVTHAITRNRVAVTRTGALLANTQLAEFVTGAEVWARVALEKDYEVDREASESADTAHESWAQKALAFNPDNGRIRINIKDLHSCFNVNNLVNNVSSADREAFERLVRNISGNTELAKSIMDWVDAGDTPLLSGTEDDGYLGRELAHRTPDTLITDVSELVAVQGMEMEDWQKLQPFLCALPESGTAININFAPAELIEALDPQAKTADILGFRESGGVFHERSQLASYGITNSNGFVFHSQYFLARIAVQLGSDGDYQQYWESTLQLDEASGEARVVQRQRREFSGVAMRELLNYKTAEAN
ncbi:type II secretion system minor pseudopilin GspK [Microbulbifer thermotolerans]|uniref:type II secretion system minor pseudopilin GspK n=1 Tax=Microbulbifer thermotolerans TaxID=252514 RepID=UPI00224A5391|nr:type II secretion system minor pseudopilin GspK [Microbulbifer thermotolerans]MCX2782335.1 type II secretion system minor pseudopilin GspK [Microbulbifer thermotolerans]MCX2840159.1 type II secretion system minor pseudopilin GspK [Microbulbifer thermotolerans]